MEVEFVLKVDRACRDFRGVGRGLEGDLHRICDLRPKEWDYSLPTLAHNDNVFLKKKIRATDAETIKEKFFKECPVFREITWDNMLVAGGCIGKHFCDIQVKNDVDIFLYGLKTVEEAEAKIKEFYDSLVAHKIAEDKRAWEERERMSNLRRGQLPAKMPVKKMRDNMPGPEWVAPEITFNMVRTRNCLTIDGKYQFIFRLYRCKSEILHGFDLGSSAIGFDGEEIYVTSLGKFAYEYSCNIVDTTRRSKSYEHRLRKYYERGFEIILPELNIEKVPDKLWKEIQYPDHLRLPYLVVSIQGKKGNKILVNEFHRKTGGPVNSRGPVEISDYGHLDDLDEYAAFYRNVYFLLRERYEDIIFVGETYSEVYEKNAECSRPKLDYFFGTLGRSILDSETFPTRMVEKYIITDTPEEIFLLRKDGARIGTILNDNKTIILSRLENVDKISTWVTENPGAQLTGSFNPVIEEPEKWYGKYWKAVERPKAAPKPDGIKEMSFQSISAVI